jgi:hypothetical protein
MRTRGSPRRFLIVMNSSWRSARRSPRSRLRSSDGSPRAALTESCRTTSIGFQPPRSETVAWCASRRLPARLTLGRRSLRVLGNHCAQREIRPRAHDRCLLSADTRCSRLLLFATNAGSASPRSIIRMRRPQQWATLQPRLTASWSLFLAPAANSSPPLVRRTYSPATGTGGALELAFRPNQQPAPRPARCRAFARKAPWSRVSRPKEMGRMVNAC